MRAKLHLTEEELMNKSWIALNLEMKDYPYFDHKAKKVITDKASGDNFLNKLKMNSDGIHNI